MNPATSAAQDQTSADQYATLKSAVLGAQANAAPGASPLGNFPEIAKLYSSAPQVEQLHLQNAGPAYNTSVQVANDAAAQQAAQQAALQKLQDLHDPSKYQQVQKQDGGYAFYDPSGNEISAQQFAAVHNSTPADVLKNSQNPLDKAFVNDYNQLESYINNVMKSGTDQKAADARQATEETVKANFGVDLSKFNPQELIQRFMQSYPTVFGGTGAGRTTFVPSANDPINFR